MERIHLDAVLADLKNNRQILVNNLAALDTTIKLLEDVYTLAPVRDFCKPIPAEPQEAAPYHPNCPVPGLQPIKRKKPGPKPRIVVPPYELPNALVEVPIVEEAAETSTIAPAPVPNLLEHKPARGWVGKITEILRGYGPLTKTQLAIRLGDNGVTITDEELSQTLQVMSTANCAQLVSNKESQKVWRLTGQLSGNI